jgi:outer membrane immunogenic protein
LSVAIKVQAAAVRFAGFAVIIGHKRHRGCEADGILMEYHGRPPMYRHLAITVVAAVLSSGLAFAGDLGTPAQAPIYMKAPAAVPYSWSGFYGGVNAGWIGSTGNTITLTGTDTGTSGLGSMLADGVIPSTVNLGYNGFLGGGQLGYNWQSGNWVFGLEGDIDGASAKSSGIFPDCLLPPPPVGLAPPLTLNAARELDWLGTVRGRIGYTPLAPFLVYATGGLAVGEHKLGIGLSDPTASPVANLFNETSSTSAGWTVGAGAEWMFARQWSLKAEYLYVDLGNVSSTINYAYGADSSSLTATVHDRDNIVRGGINYHF